MSGTVNISRGLWDDLAFRDEPFSEREAWIWMVAEASWKERQKRVGNAVIDVQLGQIHGFGMEMDRRESAKVPKSHEKAENDPC
jgi:hypothetical protein